MASDLEQAMFRPDPSLLQEGWEYRFVASGQRLREVEVILGRGGVERIIEIELDDAERAALEKSTASVKQLVNSLQL